VVVISREVVVTGKKAQNKTYEHYSGYPAARSRSLRDLAARRPMRSCARPWRLLAKTILGRGMFERRRSTPARAQHSARNRQGREGRIEERE